MEPLQSMYLIINTLNFVIPIYCEFFGEGLQHHGVVDACFPSLGLCISKMLHQGK